MPNTDVVISAAALAVFTTMMTAVISALAGMFTLAWREKQRSYDELKAQYDARYNDVRTERDRLLSVQAQADRDKLTILGIVKDGVVSLGASMAMITTTLASMQKVIEQTTRQSHG